MKTIKTTIAIALFAAFSFTSNANIGHENDAITNKKASSFAVGMYQAVNTMKMNVLVKNDNGQRIHIVLKNGNGDILHSEFLSTTSYARKFDFNEMADGQYSFEISNGTTKEVKSVKIDSKKIDTQRVITLN